MATNVLSLLWLLPFSSNFTRSVCSSHGFGINSQALANELDTNIGNEQKHRCWNCNNTEVPVFFKDFVLPQPVIIPIYQDTWHLDITYDVEVLTNLTRLEASFNVQVISDDGYTELCYVLGDRCFVQDVCEKLSQGGFRCPIPNAHYKGTAKPKLPTLPFIVTGEFLVALHLWSEGLPIGCLQCLLCINSCTTGY
ncbi:uncharacterized protein LOC127879433 isoform X1 [Dreissena polymorpha]|uniref:uncharacterized protein LOC127879433 isoform X1 n=1 Tax=Dreissena polymorpha TaxID=45954 RepID=UPI00226485A9|nr:uncharacterized protein LOC127879433 isoform X1 [Dreissena polymorpha]